MSKIDPKQKKVIKIKEAELATMIDNIVEEVIAYRKKEWIAEQTKSTSVLESRLAKLEATIKTITENKK